ncbi:MAG TPA: hypothetical protein VM163_14360, partial [bacterium]|nr:hypothetical protein [bacterium]
MRADSPALRAISVAWMVIGLCSFLLACAAGAEAQYSSNGHWIVLDAPSGTSSPYGLVLDHESQLWVNSSLGCIKMLNVNEWRWELIDDWSGGGNPALTPDGSIWWPLILYSRGYVTWHYQGLTMTEEMDGGAPCQAQLSASEDGSILCGGVAWWSEWGLFERKEGVWAKRGVCGELPCCASMALAGWHGAVALFPTLWDDTAPQPPLIEDDDGSCI